MLVLVMIIWHGTYVLMAQRWTHLGYAIQNRVEFIHYAFIAISGFLCGWYYGPKLKGDAASVRSRLFLRGLKLIFVVAASTAVLYAGGAVYGSGALKQAASTGENILNNFLLNINGSLVAFELLFYIALLLFTASVALGRPWLIGSVCAALALSLFIAPCALVLYLSFGMAGLAGGLVAGKGALNQTWDFLERTRGFPALVGLLAYQLALPQIRLLMKAGLPVEFSLYCLETLLWFMAFIFFFKSIRDGALRHWITRFGQYTLLGYISQVAVIRLLYATMTEGEPRNLDASGYLATIVLTTVFVYFLIRATDSLRERWPFFDRSYRVVFG